MTDSLASRVGELEARLGLLEDERAIGELLSRYSYYADSRRDDDWIGLWHPDGALEIALGPGAAVYGEPHTWHGHSDLRVFIANPEAHHKPGFYGRSLHVHGANSTIRIERTTAVAATYSLLFRNGDEGPELMSVGLCSWRFTKVDGHWLILECRRRRVGAADTREILGACEPSDLG